MSKNNDMLGSATKTFPSNQKKAVMRDFLISITYPEMRLTLAVFCLGMTSMGVLYQLSKLLEELMPAEKYKPVGRVFEVMIYTICAVCIFICLFGLGTMEINNTIDDMFTMKTL